MLQKAPALSKLTKAYLCKYFERKNLPYVEWQVKLDGISHTINNKSVISLILQASPQEQKIFADAFQELESSNTEINLFLKHLAFESSIASHIAKH